MRHNVPVDPLVARLLDLERRMRIMETRSATGAVTASFYLETEDGATLETEDGQPVELDL